MNELLRLVLLVGVAGAAVTLLSALVARSMAEERRLARAFRKILGQAPDATVVAHGHGRAAALSLAGGRVVTAWNDGAWCLTYGLGELLGAEVTLDGQVAGRVRRGETRKSLDRGAATAGEVRLRLLFDDPLHPDFDLQLWPVARPSPAAPANASEAVVEANRWMGRVEAILRRTGPAAAIRAAPPPSPRPARPVQQAEDLFEFDEEEPLSD